MCYILKLLILLKCHIHIFKCKICLFLVDSANNYPEQDYVPLEEKTCLTSYGDSLPDFHYTNKQSAETECNNNPECSFISSYRCQDPGKFRLCPVSGQIKHSGRVQPNCVYQKPGIIC